MTPRQWQVLTAAAIIAAAVIVQFVVLARLPIVAPGLVLCAVVGVGMAGGQTFGAVSGFCAGLAIDVMPPSSGLVGSTALALVVVGAVAGRVRDPRGLAPLQLLGIVAGLATVGALVVVAFTGLLGGSLPAAGVLAVDLVVFVVGTAVLGLAVVPATGVLIRRVAGGRRPRMTPTMR